MKVTGGCFCKALEYEAVIDPDRIGICHCRDCQIFSGSAFRLTAAVSASDFQFTKGEPTCFEKTADSGGIRRMAFCGICGTHICAIPGSKTASQYVTLRLSTSEQFDQLTPRVELFCSSKVAWLPPLEGMVQFDRMPSAPPSVSE